MNAPKPLRPSWSHFPIPGIASTSGRKGGGWEESLEASRRRPAARDRPRSQTPALRRRGLGGPRSPPPLTRCGGAPRLWGRAQERERPEAGRADTRGGGRAGAYGAGAAVRWVWRAWRGLDATARLRGGATGEGRGLAQCRT